MAEKQITEARVKELFASEVKVLVVGLETKLGELVAKALAGLATKEEVSQDLQKIIDHLKNFVPADALDERLADLITKDQWNEALEGMVSQPISLSGIHTGLQIESQFGAVPLEPIPFEYLDGLVFRSSKSKKTETGKVNVPTERPLTPEDVLTWKDNGETVTIITADGQKHTVDKE